MIKISSGNSSLSYHHDFLDLISTTIFNLKNNSNMNFESEIGRSMTCFQEWNFDSMSGRNGLWSICNSSDQISTRNRRQSFIEQFFIFHQEINLISTSISSQNWVYQIRDFHAQMILAPTCFLWGERNKLGIANLVLADQWYFDLLHFLHQVEIESILTEFRSIY